MRLCRLTQAPSHATLGCVKVKNVSSVNPPYLGSNTVHNQYVTMSPVGKKALRVIDVKHTNSNTGVDLCVRDPETFKRSKGVKGT